ncbi:unnamed protein product [Lymnaea stagnalis]|uniref:G-protein coupled receptors family 3 profile domain-containing protein n=1 Tax=Lymnaea stagnalis TaxID=6523 RepID=A0AAV2IDY9_LYMST
MNRWFHYSVLVEDDEQGRSSLKVLRGYASKYGMCICTIIKVSELADYESTIQTLLGCSAKVVVVMISKESAKVLVDAIESYGAAGKLLWIGNDNWLEHMYFTKPMEGLIVVSPSSIDLPGFVDYYKQLGITNKNPWFRKAFEILLECTNNACMRKYLSIVAGKLTLSNADIYDSVMIYARALHTMLHEKCPKFVSQGNTSETKKCFKANWVTLTAYLKKVSFKGASGHISIDSKGNKLSEIYVYQTVKDDVIAQVPKEEKFAIYHNMPSKVVKVAKYDIPNDKIYPLHQITYSSFNFNLQELFIEAKCKAPCAANEYKHYIRKCCWICKRCQDNERVSENDTACQKCPYLEWPAMNNLKLSTCKEITAVTFDWTSPVTFSLLIMAGLGIFMVLCILITLWVIYRPKMLDFGSFSVNIVQLLAIIWGYVAIPMLLLRPSVLNCNAGLILFEISFNVVYLSLLIQSVDVYRNCRRIIEPYELEYTSTPYQIGFIIVLLTIEVRGLTMAFIHYHFPIIPLEFQPVASIKYAELICEIPTPHIIAFLIFNVGVLLLCSIFALKSQNDPYGLQQSRLVAMFVVLAMIMWIAFMPAYFTSVHKQMQTYFRIMAILFNHSSALVVNFSPFVFGLIYKKYPDSRRPSYHSSSLSSGHSGMRKKSTYPSLTRPKYEHRKSTVKFEDNLTSSHKISPQPTDGSREADGEGPSTAV